LGPDSCRRVNHDTDSEASDTVQVILRSTSVAAGDVPMDKLRMTALRVRLRQDGFGVTTWNPKFVYGPLSRHEGARGDYTASLDGSERVHMHLMQGRRRVSATLVI